MERRRFDDGMAGDQGYKHVLKNKTRFNSRFTLILQNQNAIHKTPPQWVGYIVDCKPG